METPSTVNRHKAQSGRVSITEPIQIINTKQRSLEVLLQFVPHNTKPDELAAKLILWKKSTDGKFRVGFPAELTLRQTEVIALKRALEQGLALAEAGADGDYLILRLDEQETDVSGRDPNTIGRAVAAMLEHPNILEAALEEPALLARVRLQELSRAVGQLEAMLEGGVVDEQKYQEWTEKHSWAFGNIYAVRDSVRTIAIGDSVDHLVAATATGLRDVFELKRPNMPVLSYDESHRSYFWSRDTSQAIGQCHRYLDALREAAAHGLRDHPEIVAYHPRATVVIGRSNGWDEGMSRALHGLNARLHGVQVMTYDHLLAQARRFIEVLRDSATA